MADPQPQKPQGPQRPVFSREAIEAKQKEQLRQFQEQMVEMRKALEEVVSTIGGEKVLKFLFLVSGGDKITARRDQEGKIDMSDTLMAIGAKGVYEALRMNMTTETIAKIETHSWEK